MSEGVDGGIRPSSDSQLLFRFIHTSLQIPLARVGPPLLATRAQAVIGDAHTVHLVA